MQRGKRPTSRPSLNATRLAMLAAAMVMVATLYFSRQTQPMGQATLQGAAKQKGVAAQLKEDAPVTTKPSPRQKVKGSGAKAPPSPSPPATDAEERPGAEAELDYESGDAAGDDSQGAAVSEPPAVEHGGEPESDGVLGDSVDTKDNEDDGPEEQQPAAEEPGKEPLDTKPPVSQGPGSPKPSSSSGGGSKASLPPKEKKASVAAPPTEKASTPAAGSGSGPSAKEKYRVVVTAGEGIYTQWTMRVCYFWYKKTKEDFPGSHMGGFTRLLHTGKADAYMDEIPTILVDPLPDDIKMGYQPLDRPWAFVQWVKKYAADIEEDYVLQSEPDHIFLRPPPMWATPTKPAAAPFDYMMPTNSHMFALMAGFNKNNISADQFDATGSSPTITHKDMYASFVEEWYNIEVAIHHNKTADTGFGWIQEMYAYILAAANAPGGPIRHEIHPEFFAQPPNDMTLEREAVSGEKMEAYIIHYTWGLTLDEKGERMEDTLAKTAFWHFDKRDSWMTYPPVPIPMPPKGTPYTAYEETVRRINQAAASLPDFPPPCPFEDWPVTVRCKNDGAIYQIEGRKRRTYSPTAYKQAGFPEYFHVDCNHIMSCAPGVSMPEPEAKKAKKDGAAKKAEAVASTSTDPGQRYHVLLVSGPGIHDQWQSRVHHYWYKQVKSEFPGSAMGGYTRLMHGGQADGYTEEIPTVVVSGLPPQLVKKFKDTRQLQRPYAVKQWLEGGYAKTIPEQYVLLSEPDHIFVLPPPLWATPRKPAAFEFGWMVDDMKKESHIAALSRFNTKNVSMDQFDPAGPSPLMMHRDHLAAIADSWHRTALAIKADEQADTTFGWMIDTWAYVLAAAQAEGGAIRHELHPELAIHPPWDPSLKMLGGSADGYILHYTYWADFDKEGKFVPSLPEGERGAWHFAKRDYMDNYPPLDYPLPPLGDATESTRELIRRINQASAALADWGSKAGAMPESGTTRRMLGCAVC